MAKVNFRANAELKSIIGKDLITDDNIAILELVKNSFDAGSKYVEIVFKNIIHQSIPKDYKRENSSEIFIIDEGQGMSRFDIENKWLNIAYSEKKEIKEAYGRVLAGNKGVGRFSCDRLGKYLTIYTRKKNGPYIKLFINWKEFEFKDDINLNIGDIELILEEINEQEYLSESDCKTIQSGTILRITSLREEWSHSKLLQLRRQLEKLINPNQSFKSNKFVINIVAPEFTDLDINRNYHERVNGVVENLIFKKLDFKVTSIQAKITSDGEHIITILKDRGVTLFTLIEKNKFNLLKNVKVHIYYLNTYSKIYFNKQTGIRANDFGSISLFINGFRIPPYGDYGDDWLGMENRKNQGRSRFLGTREVIGRIEVFDNKLVTEDEDDEFKIISSRAGIVNNNIFFQLANKVSPYGFYYKIFRRLERFVVEGINWDSVIEKNTPKLERQVLSKGWKEENEQYIEDQLVRNRRALSVIENIIDVKKEEVSRLIINREFISDLIQKQSENIQKEIENIVDEINNKDLSSAQLSSLLDKLGNSHESAAKLLTAIPSQGVKKIKDLEKRISELDGLESEIELLRNSKAVAEENARRLSQELEIERQKNTYLRTSSRNLTEDAKGLVHNIKITSKKISDSVDNLYNKILKGSVDNRQIITSLAAIKFQSEKALKISNIITRANFSSDKNAQIVDVVKYIKQYISIYSDIYPKSEMEFDIIDNDCSLTKKISVLEISVILDDLISNSEKALANKILIEIENNNTGGIDILFSDNGTGVPEQFLLNKNKIFELGVTTTDGGSGIGLNSVRMALRSMRGEIEFLGNSVRMSGASFKIQL